MVDVQHELNGLGRGLSDIQKRVSTSGHKHAQQMPAVVEARDRAGENWSVAVRAAAREPGKEKCWLGMEVIGLAQWADWALPAMIILLLLVQLQLQTLLLLLP